MLIYIILYYTFFQWVHNGKKERKKKKRKERTTCPKVSRVALSLYSIAGSENVFRYLGLSVGELRCGFSQTSQPPPSPTTITNHTSTSTTTHVQSKKKKNIYIKNKTHLSLIASPARWVLLLYHFYNFSCLLSFVYTCLSICTSMNRVYCVMMLTRIECFLVTKSSNCVSMIIL